MGGGCDGEGSQDIACRGAHCPATAVARRKDISCVPLPLFVPRGASARAAGHHPGQRHKKDYGEACRQGEGGLPAQAKGQNGHGKPGSQCCNWDGGLLESECEGAAADGHMIHDKTVRHRMG
jgi:hypothetical protein